MILLNLTNFQTIVFATQTNTTTPGQSGPGCNGNEGILPIEPEMEAPYQMQFYN